MCSFIGQIAFICLMVICLSLTLGSLFSPGWYKDNNGNESGILNCKYNSTNTQQQNEDRCKEWWNKQPGTAKATVILMIIALLVEIFAIGWAIASFCACCCRTSFLNVLPIAAIVVTILLAISMILFGVNHDIKEPKNGQNVDDLDRVSYSFWLGIGATIVAIIAAIVGAISAWFSHILC